MRALRVVALLALAAGLVVLLFTVVFPWFDANFVSDPVVTGSAGIVAPRPALAT